MKISLEKIENNTAHLKFEVDEEQFEKAMEQAYRKNVKRFAIPGFRRGKAPRKLIEMHYGPEVFYEDAAEIILPQAYQQGVEEYHLEPVDQPRYDIEQIEKGKPMIAKAEVTVRPEVKLKEYKGLEVEKVVYNVTEEDVEKELAAIQEKNARLVAVEDRPACKGDIAVIDFDGKIDDKPFEGGKAENYPLELGSGAFVDGFEDQVVGMNPGEKKEISVTFPEDYKVESLAGKSAVFSVTLKELKKKELSPLDDEFAKDVSEFDTLEELKNDIRNKLVQRAKAIEEGSLKSSIIDKLMKTTEVDIPHVMIHREIDRLIMDFAINLKMRGYDLKTYMEATKITPEEFRAKFHEKAHVNVKSSLILEEVARREGITVTDEETDAEIKKYADLANKTVEEYKNNLKPEDISGIKDTILTKKIFDFLISNAKITEKKLEDIKNEQEQGNFADEEEHTGSEEAQVQNATNE
ncbi:MAG TPA: trigger factor [Thermoanaerobacterales bacterium]|nr:trigger factor [Thermoanaerobacterales bacterium]